MLFALVHYVLYYYCLLVKRSQICSLLLSENDSLQNMTHYQWMFAIQADSLCKSILEKAQSLSLSLTHTHTHTERSAQRSVSQEREGMR